MRLTAIAACLALSACDGSRADKLFIIDGDTFAIGSERMRVMGMDAPELHPARCAGEASLGEQARQELGRLLATGYTLSRHGADRYGRTLATVYVDGQDVALTMIADGLARPYSGHTIRAPWC